MQSNVHMNLVQPAGEWCGDLLHADCGDCVVCSFNLNLIGPSSRSFILRNLSLVTRCVNCVHQLAECLFVSA